MKKILLVLLALLLALMPVLSGCASHGKTLITARDEEISVNVFQLYLSRMKGSLSAAGYRVSSADFWKTYMDADNTTYAEHYTGQVLEGLKQIAAALILYDELGLKLDKAVEKSIDEWIDALIDEVGGGSKSGLNSVLSAYGANITVLRDAAIIEAKVDQLKTHLYGEGGSLLSATAKEDFYKSAYYAGTQMLLANTYHRHDRDDEGQTVYYKKDGNGNIDTGHIAYLPAGDEVEATAEVDKNGDTVYRYKADVEIIGGAVAYDEENGLVRYYYHENGEPITEEYTEAEMLVRQELAMQIAEACMGDEALFDEYIKKWSDNLMTGDDSKPNRMYFTPGVYTGDDIISTLSAELAKLDVEETAVLSSSQGYYIIMRVELDTGAWQKEENKTWFTGLTGLAVEDMLQKRCAQYLSEVWVDEEQLRGVDITTVGANTYY